MSLPPAEGGILRVVVATSTSHELAVYIGAREAQLEFRSRTLDTVSLADLEWADALVAAKPPPDLPLNSVPWVHSTFAGVDAFLHNRTWPHTTLLTRTVGAFGLRIGEYCLCRALLVSQEVIQLLRQQQRREWVPPATRLLFGSTALVVGTGHVGRGIASAFVNAGAHVEGVSRSGTQVHPFSTVYDLGSLSASVRQKDWIILALPLTHETSKLFDRTVLDHCEGGTLINVSRGQIVDDVALVDALERKRLAMAILDVFTTEPLPEDSPLWSRSDVLISPHCAAVTETSEAGDSFIEVLRDLKSGRTPRLRADPSRGY